MSAFVVQNCSRLYTGESGIGVQGNEKFKPLNYTHIVLESNGAGNLVAVDALPCNITRKCKVLWCPRRCFTKRKYGLFSRVCYATIMHMLDCSG